MLIAPNLVAIIIHPPSSFCQADRNIFVIFIFNRHQTALFRVILSSLKNIYNTVKRGDEIKKLIKTVTLVTSFSILERFIGFIYRIYLSHSLGAEGLGIYQIALTLFGFLLTLASSGTPITISRMITKYRAAGDEIGEKSTLCSGVIFSLIICIPCILIYYTFSNRLLFLFSDERCALVFKIILPGLILSAIYAVVRGYFWGNKSFFIYSIIELLEELVMVIVGVALIRKSHTLNEGISRAAIAVIMSYVFSFITSLIMFKRLGGGLASSKKTLKPFTLSALPITAMRTSTALVNSLIVIILPSLLTKSGLTTSQAISIFGAAFGMAMPVLFMPSTLIGSIAVVLVPELSENYYKNNSRTLNKNINSALKFAIYVSYIIIPILLVYGKNIGIILFNSTEAGEFLSLTSPITLPMSISIITTSILNSLNQEKSTFIYFLFGAVSLLASIYILTPTLGIYSLSVGLAVQFCISAICNTLKLIRMLKAKHGYTRFALKGLFLLISSTIFAYFTKNIVNRFLPNVLSAVLCCCLSAAFISTLLVATGSIDIKNRSIK